MKQALLDVVIAVAFCAACVFVPGLLEKFAQYLEAL